MCKLENEILKEVKNIKFLVQKCHFWAFIAFFKILSQNFSIGRNTVKKLSAENKKSLYRNAISYSHRVLIKVTRLIRGTVKLRELSVPRIIPIALINHPNYHKLTNTSLATYSSIPISTLLKPWTQIQSDSIVINTKNTIQYKKTQKSKKFSHLSDNNLFSVIIPHAELSLSFQESHLSSKRKQKMQ